MTPFEVVLQSYQFPEYIDPHPLQVGIINRRCESLTSGKWMDMGTGKTFCSTAWALFQKIQFGTHCIVIMPPLLIPQWGRWLREISPSVTVVEYRGSPAERKKLNLNADFVLVGIQIFKRDYRRICDELGVKALSVIVDEATMIGNSASDNHNKVYDFAAGHYITLLSGTPTNKPQDAYGLIKFTAPGTYRNMRHFMNMHVEEYDFFGTPIKYQNLDILSRNLMINSERLLFEDMYDGNEDPLFTPTYYDLDKDHYKLYTKLAEDELLKLPDGGKIDATSAARLRHALGQIVVNWGHFAGEPGLTSDAVGIIEQTLDELGTGKLVIFADYKMTIAVLKAKLLKYGAVTVNSEVTEAQKEKNIQTFIKDPACRVIIVNFVSGGKGLDGLQHVCNDCIFIEPCRQPRDFHQAVARLKRMGQKKRVRVKMAIASGTTQVRGFKSLLENDELVNQVIRNKVELRKAIFGE